MSCRRGFYRFVLYEKKRRAGYQIKFVTLPEEPGLTLCYGERALPSQDKDKPTVLFIHGLGLDKSTWYTVTRKMASTQHAICLDLPGHGGSSFKPDDDLNTAGMVKRIHEFVRAIKLHRITGGLHLIGASWGASIAGEFAFKYGEEDGVRFVTLICMPVHVPEPSEFMIRLKKGEFNEIITPEKPEDTKKFWQMVFYKRRLYTLYSSKWYYMTNHETRVPQYAQIRKIWACLGGEVLKSSITTMRLGLWKNHCSIPMHVIWGRHDKLYPAQGALIMSEALQCKSTVLENAGHLVQQEEAKKVADEILDFRKKCIANK